MQKFFSVIDNRKHRLCFEIQAYLGLRIGEAVKVNLADIDFRNKQMRVYAPKTDSIDFLPLHDKIYEILSAWVRACNEEITANGGYLLFPDKKRTSKLRRSMSTHIVDPYMRRVFKDYIKRANLDEVYATISTVEGQPGESRKLYRLSTHSLRHYFITRVYKKTLNPLITQNLARHRAFGTTQGYINLSTKDNVNAMKQAFEEQEPEPIVQAGSNNLQEFLTFYEAWKKHTIKQAISQV